MTNSTNKISLSGAAIITGITILISAIAAPFAEIYVYPKLILPYKTVETATNILANKTLFVAAIFAYLATFICDVVLTWSLYILLRPVNAHLSLLTAMFRLVYSVIALAALLNLVTAFQLLDTPGYRTIFEPNDLYTQVMVHLRAFRNHWYFGIIFFSLHLLLLGYLVIKSKYIPIILGVLLMIAGLGYMLTTLRPYLYANLKVDFALYTFFGELIFMLWLLIKGRTIQEPGWNDQTPKKILKHSLQQ